MTAQLDLFGAPKPIRERRDWGRIIEQSCSTRKLTLFERMAQAARGKGDPAKLARKLRAASSGGLVNGMSKAALRRYAPERLPPITVPRGEEA
jgi:hypothetical protein